ncbi:MAG TPA: cell division protein FtsZ [Thermoplasmataceae archaeon]|nr:cell division protein FtsZ [Thermoplasmatales archaeon AK]HLH86372.1 cell division protein FtsZ [Thermoplasmataceae archaeon]
MFSKDPFSQDHEEDDFITSDEELQEYLEKLRVKIRIFGAGGAGSNTINRLMKEGISGAQMIACNTDAPHLLRVKANNKILMGKTLTRGLGSGADPRVGEQAAKESDQEIMKFLSGSDIVFVTAGLGGGTGTGSAHYIAGRARDNGALAISVVTLPFKSEGKIRMDNACWGLNRLLKASDTVIIIPNDKLLELVPDMPLEKAFRFADEIIVKSITGISDLVTKPGLINLDFNDLRTVMKNSGLAMIGMGLSSGEPGSRLEEAVQKALNSPFLQLDMSTATGVIINVTGGTDMQLEEASTAADMIRKKVGRTTRIIWGATVDPKFNGQIEVLLVATGLSSDIVNCGDSQKSNDGIDLVS